ncbi:MAG: hypothetical protein AB7O97_22835 [Planctomycetota bacterium]
MTSDVHTRPLRSAIVTIALLSAALLVFLVLLQRVCAVRMHAVHGLWVGATALLGVGVAAAVLALLERSWRLLPEAWVRRLSGAFLLSLPLCWAWLLHAPVPASPQFDSAGSAVQLLGFQVAAAVPFALGGAAVGLLVGSQAATAHLVHGAGLLGIGLGCAAAPTLLWEVGAGGLFVVAMLLAGAACAASAPMDVVPRTLLMLGAAVGGYGMHGADALLPVPGPEHLAITATDEIELAPAAAFVRWSGEARVALRATVVESTGADDDVMPVGSMAAPAAETDSGLTAPMLGPAAPQWWLRYGAGAGEWLHDGTAPVAALALQRGNAAEVCVLGIGAGTELRSVLAADASRVRAIEPDRGVLALHSAAGATWPTVPLTGPNLEVLADAPRSVLMRSDERFDVLLCLDRSLPAAAASRARDLVPEPLYTVEGCRTLCDRLSDGGVLEITRNADAAETIRLLNDLFHAFSDAERPTFADAVAVLRDAAGLRVTVLLQKGGFAAEGEQRLAAFARDHGLQLVVDPAADLRAVVAGRSDAIVAVEQELERIDREIGVRNEGVDDKELQRLRAERITSLAPLEQMRGDHDVAAFLLAADKGEFAAGYPFDVRPVTDDRPFFHQLGSGGAAAPASPQRLEVGAGTLHRYLGLGVILAVVLMLLPLLLRGGAGGESRHGAGRFLIYFTAVALGFVGIAAALQQKFALLLGPPEYSTSITLAALWIAAAVGAVLSHGALNWEPQRGRYVAIGVFAAAGLVAFLSPAIVDLCIGLSPAWRAAVVAIVVAPLGLLLGMPLAHGMRVVEHTNPGLVPWAWAVTAATGAVGTLVATELALGFGYSAVLFGSGLLFLLALVAIDALARDVAAGNGVPVEGEEYADGGEVEFEAG